MKRTRKAILSILFALAMLIGMMPASAFATTTDATPTVAPTAAAADATVAPTEAAGGPVTYSGSYSAYMGFQTDTTLWIFRNAYDDASYGFGTPQFTHGLCSVSGTETTEYDGTFTDATVDGDGTYTVTLENPDLQDETHISLLFVSTNIPLSDSIKVTNVKVKFDGSTKYTFDEAILDPESEEYVKILCQNNWNNDVKELFGYPMPFSKCEVQFTIEGLGYEGTQPTVAPTAAAAATPTTAADTTNDSSSDSDSGNIVPIVIAVIAVVVVIVVVVVVVATKKKK
jgi:hypothetical protein